MPIWTPKPETTRLWLDADHDPSFVNYENDAEVIDRSPVGWVFNRIGGASSLMRIPAAQNNKSVLHFTGTRLRLQDHTVFQSLERALVIAVLHPTTTGGQTRWVSSARPGDSNSSWFRIALGRSAGRWSTNATRLANQSAVEINDPEPAYTDRPVLISVDLDFINGTMEMRVGGEVRATASLPSAGQSTSGISPEFSIGGGLGGGNVVDGFFCELAVLADEAAELSDKWEGYTAHKWGIQSDLVEGHPYENEPPFDIRGRFYGTVRDKDGAPAARKITIINAQGECEKTGTSDPSTGEYDLIVGTQEPCTILFTGEPDRNAIVFENVTPEPVT